MVSAATPLPKVSASFPLKLWCKAVDTETQTRRLTSPDMSERYGVTMAPERSSQSLAYQLRKSCFLHATCLPQDREITFSPRGTGRLATNRSPAVMGQATAHPLECTIHPPKCQVCKTPLVFPN